MPRSIKVEDDPDSFIGLFLYVLLFVKIVICHVGYQRILGDKCEPDEEAYTKWEPLHRACPSQPPTQFLMVLDRHNVHRLTITDNAVDNIDKVVDVGPHNEILSIGFSYSKNILFYAEKCSHDSRNSMVKVRSVFL